MADALQILSARSGRSVALQISPKQLTRPKELGVREYTPVSRLATTDRSAQDLCSEALVIPTHLNGLLVSNGCV